LVPFRSGSVPFPGLLVPAPGLLVPGRNQNLTLTKVGSGVPGGSGWSELVISTINKLPSLADL
jgi:hypothetical protein